MNHVPECKSAGAIFDAWLDGDLPQAEADALEQHMAGCMRCTAARAQAEALRTALRAMPVPAMRPGFPQAALAAAVARDVGPKQATVPTPRAARRPWLAWWHGSAWWPGVVAGAVAAAALVVTLWGVPQQPMPSEQAVPQPAEITLALYEPRDVTIAIDAAQPMPGARLTVRVAGGIELVGFGDTRELSWETNLEQGTNMLSLPLLAYSLEQAQLTALVEYGERRQQIDLAIRTDAPGGERP